eukprot:Hpha_TRINITY_DN16195_c0_g3::TRINITY_DN16195_c0_g3_i1::g.8880::m.8880
MLSLHLFRNGLDSPTLRMEGSTQQLLSMPVTHSAPWRRAIFGEGFKKCTARGLKLEAPRTPSESARGRKGESRERRPSQERGAPKNTVSEDKWKGFMPHASHFRVPKGGRGQQRVASRVDSRLGRLVTHFFILLPNQVVKQDGVEGQARHIRVYA